MRDKLLNESLFFGLRHARQKVAAWALVDNTCWPHSTIGYLTPEAIVSSVTATGRPAAQPGLLLAPLRSVLTQGLGG